MRYPRPTAFRNKKAAESVTARGFLFINESNRLAQADRYRDNNTDNKNCLRH